MADSFRRKISSGQAKWASGGFGGTGFKFDPSEKNKAQKLADMQRRQYEVDQGLRDAEDFYSDQDDDDELEALKDIATHLGLSTDAVDRLLKWTEDGYAWMNEGYALLNDLA